jgi:hypothetical protein
MRYITIAVIAGFLSACAAPYQVDEATDKFSDPTKPAVYSMKSNNVDFRDPMGLVAASELNFFVERDRTSGKAIAVGLDAFVVSYEFDGKWLNIRPGDEIVFLANGERIAAKAISTRIDHQVGRGASANTQYYDQARYLFTPAQFKKLSNADRLEIKIQGMNRAVSYPRPNQKYLDSFQPNIQRFYQEQVAPFM